MSDEETVSSQSGLTPSEERIMAHLVAAWNAWNKQDDLITSQEMQQFIDGIHMAQEVLAARALYRAYPEYWSDPQVSAIVSSVIHVHAIEPNETTNLVMREIDRRLRQRS